MYDSFIDELELEEQLENTPSLKELEHRIQKIEEQNPVIKELQKIKLEENEALIIKFPKESDPQSISSFYKHVCNIMQTDKIFVLIGDVELSKVEHSKFKKHPLYSD